jgi:hypothetical protein
MTAPTMTVYTRLQLFIDGPQPKTPDEKTVELSKALRASVIAAVSQTLASLGVEAKIVCEPRPAHGLVVGEAS